MSNKPFIVRSMPIMRRVTFAFMSVFSIAVLGASGHYINLVTTKTLFVDGLRAWPQSAPDPFSAFDLAVAVLTFIFLKPMLIIDFFRRGAFTSLIVTELVVFGFFSIFWLTAAAWTSSVYPPVGDLCSANPDVSVLVAGCTDIQVEMAFGWLAWILALTYFVLLLTMSIIASNKGKPVWKSTIRETDFGYGGPTVSSLSNAPAMTSNEAFLMKQQGSTPQTSYVQPQPYNPNLPYDPPRGASYNSAQRPAGTPAGYPYGGVAQV